MMPRIIVASRFSIRRDKSDDGYLNILFESGDKSMPTERVTFDGTIIGTNIEMFKQYAAGLRGEA